MKLKKGQIEKLKTITIVVLSIIVFFGGVYVISEKGIKCSDSCVKNSGPGQEQDNPLLEEGQVLPNHGENTKRLTEVSFDGLKDLLKSKDTKMVFLGTDECIWCVHQKPVLEDLMTNKELDVYYLDTSKLEDKHFDELGKLHNDLERFGTPTFIFIKDGKVENVSTGARSTSGLIEIMVANGILNN